MTVVGVDDGAASPTTTRRIVDGRGEPSQGAGLGGVSVKDIGLVRKDDAQEPRECSNVSSETDVPPKAGDASGRKAKFRDEILEASFSRSWLTVDKKSFESLTAKAAVEDGHMSRGPTNVEPGDHADHANGMLWKCRPHQFGKGSTDGVTTGRS